jgi:hypothetical protein
MRGGDGEPHAISEIVSWDFAFAGELFQFL